MKAEEDVGRKPGCGTETLRRGARLAGLLRDGDVVLLTGELGAGKSEFARGVARGLGVAGPVPSPSFTILNMYREGRLVLKHFDWYRVRDAEELFESGLDEWIGGEGVTLIEWHERAPGLVPEDCLEVVIKGEGSRRRSLLFVRRGKFRSLPLRDPDGPQYRGATDDRPGA